MRSEMRSNCSDLLIVLLINFTIKISGKKLVGDLPHDMNKPVNFVKGD